MNKINSNVKIALLCGAALSVSMPTMAQTSEIDEIVVTAQRTGSLVPRNVDNLAPLEVIDADAISRQGASNVIDVAKNLTVNSGSTLTTPIGDLAGSAQINLRGLGLGSTLTLINGRRAGISPTADAGGNDFFDVNQLPLAMIERIEVLKDGASTTYGSQAVSGVANIITRKGFEGLELSTRYETSTNDAFQLNLAAGSAVGERGHFNIYASYYDQERGDRSDYDFIVNRLGGTQQGVDPSPSSSGRLTSSTGQPGSYVAAVTDPVTGVVSTLSGSTLPDPNCAAAGGILVGSRCRHDFFDQVSVIHGEERFQVFSEFDYEISDKLELFGEASFSRNKVDRTSGPGLFQNGLVETGAILVPGDHPFNFFVEDATAATGLRYVEPADWDPATDVAVDVVCICRPLGDAFNGQGNGPDKINRIDNWRAVGGANYDLTDIWKASVSFQHSEARRVENVGFNFIADNINASALDGSWNPFGSALATPGLVSPKDGVSVAGNTEFVLDNLFTTETRTFESDQTTIDGLITGELFELPGGTIGVAFGAQYREESFAFTPDALKAAAGSESRNPQFGASGTQDVVSIFGEAILPVTENLEVQVALRHEDYGDDQGGSTTDPKVAARLDATDWLSVRGSWGTSFQAPTLRQSTTATSRAIFDDSAVVDPVTGNLSCGAGGNSISGELLQKGSPDLGPQSAENYNFGFIVKPKSGLSFIVDYWNFDYEDLIAPDEGAQTIINNDCADDGIPNDPRIERDSGGNIRRVSTFFVNTARVKTDGVDATIDYQFGMGNNIDAGLNFNASWVNSFSFQSQEGGDFTEGVGSRNFTNSFTSLPEWRFNVGGVLEKGPHQLSTTVRYIDSYLNDNPAINEMVDSHTTVDLQYALSLEDFFGGKATSFSIGANNVFDKQPPTLGFRERPGFDPNVHDIRGRIFYVAAKRQF